jgi:hypothetical protein
MEISTPLIRKIGLIVSPLGLAGGCYVGLALAKPGEERSSQGRTHNQRRWEEAKREFDEQMIRDECPGWYLQKMDEFERGDRADACYLSLPQDKKDGIVQRLDALHRGIFNNDAGE